ncbi:histone-lysine N-methyltransferase SETMAR-like [Penaeus monodon]|uniref:histone-lysine N-methyltransferase SETMAR-like n=1 Tax=Penaeus monodon TaxID=6687 RepID=UPI0018A75C6D|nr:histone-lysine N-methyltransferase SETMAR-like [Penaeus monodon]
MIPFFDSKVMIYIQWAPSGQTVNKEYCVEVLREFRKRFSSQKASAKYLTEMGIKTVLHPPYSPDLAPCDFWLSPKLKDNLRGSRFETTEEMKEAVTRVVDTFTLEDIQGAFQKLLERYNKRIAAGREYFEGD